MQEEIFSSKPYSSIFFQSDRFGVSPTPHTARSTDQTAATTAAAAIASLSNLMSDHRDLTNRFILCMSELNKTFKEAETLRQENTNLRFENVHLRRQIDQLPDASVASPDPPPFDGEQPGCDATEKEKNASESPVVENESNKQDVETERVSLPKSISVRSNGYLKTSPGIGIGSSGSSSEGKPKQRRGGSSTTCAVSPVSGPQKVYVRGGGKKEGPIELDVFNQGMFKTELCNKWQETGKCPYGDHCQFAHGIKELRPVIRHPRYKTEVCRMVLAGDSCPYGHRCHFRHALSPEEQAALPLRLE